MNRPDPRYPYEIIGMECMDYVDPDNADKLARAILKALFDEEWAIVRHNIIGEAQTA